MTRSHLSVKTKQAMPRSPDILFQSLVDHMNEAVWLGDENERTVYANPKFCQMVGYSLREIIGWESYAFWDKESAERVRKVNEKHRARGISSSYEGNILSKSGTMTPVLLSGTPLPWGGTIGIMTNLTELKKKEEARRVLGSAVEYATDAIIIFNNLGEVTSWNKGAKIIFGYKKDEIVGVTLDRIFPKNDIHELLSQSEIMFNLELSGIHKNKKVLNISATLTPIKGEDGRALNYCLLIGRDVTNQKKIEEELTLKYQKIKEAYNKFGIIRRQMDYTFELMELAAIGRDLKSIADFVVSSLIMLSHADGCVLRFFQKKSKSLRFLSSFGVLDEWKGKGSIPYAGSLAEKAFERGLPIKIIDISQEPRYRSPHLAKKNNLLSLLLIPLRYKNELIGTLSLYARPERKLEIFENEFIEQYAKTIALVLGSAL